MVVCCLFIYACCNSKIICIMAATFREFLVLTAEHYFNEKHLNIDNKSEEVLTNFLHTPQVLLIQCYAEGGRIHLCTEILGGKGTSVVFYKNAGNELSKGDSEPNISVLSLSNTPVESLYHILHQIYSPLMAKGTDLYYSKVQKNLSELESILRIISYGKNQESLNVILSIEDEIDYWKTLAEKKETTKKEREAAMTFAELFQDVSEELRSMQSSTMADIREAVENTGGLLDDIWRHTVMLYPKDRMKHVFDIIGHAICSNIRDNISKLNLWQTEGIAKDNEILTVMLDSLNVVQTWTSACQSLTETYWPNYALHAWTGKPYVTSYCTNFENRLKEIFDIKSTHNQLVKLLSYNERQELKTDQMFQAFDNVNLWLCNGPNQAWENAVSRFSASLRPAEMKIADKLKPRLHNTSTKQMLYEFLRYKTLINRPLVKQALNNELETFMSSLAAMLRSIQSDVDSDEADVRMYQPPEMSPVVHHVQWARQMEAKVKDIHMCAEKYLKEFEGSAELIKLSVQLEKDLKLMYTQLHEEWARDIQAQVKSGSLTLSLDKPVVEFSPDSRMMVVNFNPRLVWGQLEARALVAMGLPAPPQILSDDITPKLQYARALQQVASFHNTLGERMIPSTRPMMLSAALDLSALVQDQRAVYWDDVKQLQAYTERLKNSVLKLETQNTYLTSQHIAIRGIVENLMNTELLAKQNEWKKGVKDIRDIIEKVEANGYKNTEQWRSHWDWQLYKALECQYIRTLLSLHKHFPTLKVDLVLRGRAVRSSPPPEQLRAQHYGALRRLVALPGNFVGLRHDAENIFTDIVDKHSWLGNKAVKAVEAALSSLERTTREWGRRAALACVPDLDALCARHLLTAADWELNFKACKAYGQAVAKMSFEDEKIDWIIVGTATLRREFEAQARNLWACLISSLQTSCRNDATELETFMASAMVMLDDKSLPKNAKELAEISAKQQALQAKLPEIEKLVDSLTRKGGMLRLWGGDPAPSALRDWLRLRERLLAHQLVFQQQAEIVKSSLTGEWENLNSSIESWLSRWSQSKARMEETRSAQFAEMLDRCRSVFEGKEQWQKLVADRDELVKECEKFGMTTELSQDWKEAEKLVSEYTAMWTPLKDYNEEYESMASQEWLVFQKKLHLLDEFSTKWSGLLEPFTAVTLFMKQELNKYLDLTPLLRYLRGTDFTERHWREVYSLLDMEYKKPDTLVVRDFLNAAGNIKKHFKDLQKLSVSAASESAIRSAINELEIWFAGARLTVTYYTDKTKRAAPIVKDYKDLLAKIEEQQWVVSSLGGSEGAGGAGGAADAWGARLRSARQRLRAAAHAQRRKKAKFHMTLN